MSRKKANMFNQLEGNRKRRFLTTTTALFGFILVGICFTFFCTCHPKSSSMKPEIDIQGHRGCRGLRPENTIMAFKRAIDTGVSTLELDVVVNKYNEVIISHEPFFNHEKFFEITTKHID